MIYHFNTLFSGKSIGRYYNQCCALIPDGNWICFWDSDVMIFNTLYADNKLVVWNDFLLEAIARYPDVGLFTCVTNRIGTHKQRVDLQTSSELISVLEHRDYAAQRYSEMRLSVRTDAKTASGLMMLFLKETWKIAGGFSEDGILGVDTRFTRAVSNSGKKIGILDGLYVLHYYRMREKNGNHLIK